MAIAALEVEIVNKVTNIGALAEEKAALSGALGGGSGGVILGAPGSGAAHAAEHKAAATGAQDLEGKFKSASVAAGGLGQEAGGLTAKLGALGALGFTPVGAAIIGGVVALGASVMVGKDWVDNAEKQQAVTKDLADAYGYLNEKVPTKAINDFIDTNKRFIPSMYDAEEGFASLARAGFNDTMQMRLMNDAVDLAAIKHISLSDAVAILTKAHGGQIRSLAELGLTVKDVTADVGKNADGTLRFSDLLDKLEPKLKNGRTQYSDLAQASNKLGHEWDKVSNEFGPPLEKALAGVLGGVSDLVDSISKVNWKPFLKGWQDDVVTPLTNFFGMLHGWGNDWNTFVRMLGGTTSGTGGGGSQTGYRGRNTTAPAQASSSSRPRGFVNTRD